MSRLRFEWDEMKSRANERKHGISFPQAAQAFYDPFHLAEKERIVDGEVRWQTLGMVGGELLLLVAHTFRSGDDEEVIRIISARRAVRSERKRYEVENA